MTLKYKIIRFLIYFISTFFMVCVVFNLIELVAPSFQWASPEALAGVGIGSMGSALVILWSEGK
jgi:hypothetical protein